MVLSGQIIKLKLKSFDHRLLDESTNAVVNAVKMTGAEVKGPIPLPVKYDRVTVNRSTHVNKKSREQFEIRQHERLLHITPAADTIDKLMGLKLSSGVEVAIKLIEE